jgi:hypothetical protein
MLRYNPTPEPAVIEICRVDFCLGQPPRFLSGRLDLLLGYFGYCAFVHAA